ncbi:hypothetical protein U1Q18_011210 [Sarracenia purpurea var. burkii]
MEANQGEEEEDNGCDLVVSDLAKAFIGRRPGGELSGELWEQTIQIWMEVCERIFRPQSGERHPRASNFLLGHTNNEERMLLSNSII